MKAESKFEYTQDEAKKMYPAFFEKYGDVIENKIPDVIRDCFEIHKAKLRSVLPFDGLGRVAFMEYTSTEDQLVKNGLPNTLSTISRMCALSDKLWHVSESQIIAGRLKTGEKLAKAILSAIPAMQPEHLRKRLCAHDLCLELPRLPLAKRHDPECILQNFYSEVAKLRGQKLRLVLSVNPYDILNAGNARFKSCNSLGGAYEQAPMSAASSEYMAILRLEYPDGTMVGRNYIAFGPDFKSLVIQPTYGFMNTAYLTDAVAWITKMLDKKFTASAGVEWRHNRNARDLLPDTGVLSEAKFGIFYTDPSRELYYRTDCEEYIGIRVGDCVCLFCGNKSKQLCCSDCQSKFVRCGGCNKYFVPALHNNSAWCLECEKNARTCKKCGGKFIPPAEDTEHVVHNYCHNCYLARVYCIVCHEYVISSRNVLTPGHTCGFLALSNLRHAVPCTDTFLTLVPGALGVHTACAEKAVLSCTKCGSKTLLHPHDHGECRRCAGITAAKENAVHNLKDMRRNLSALKSRSTAYDYSKVQSLGSPIFSIGDSIDNHNYALAA